jgi:large subunit ribosomal protein L10
MNRQEKESVVADVRQLLQESQATFLVNYKGMDVATTRNLRTNLRSQGGSFRVVKATLMRRAAHGLEGMDSFSTQFKEQIGLVFARNDVSVVAKTLVAFAKENNFPEVLSGFYESRMLGVDSIKLIASLPSREVLLAQVVGTMQAPIAQFVRVLHILIARLLYVLNRIAEKNSQ